MVGLGRGKPPVTQPSSLPESAIPVKTNVSQFIPRQVRAKKPIINAPVAHQLPTIVLSAVEPDVQLCLRPPDDDDNAIALQQHDVTTSGPVDGSDMDADSDLHQKNEVLFEGIGKKDETGLKTLHADQNAATTRPLPLDDSATDHMLRDTAVEQQLSPEKANDGRNVCKVEHHHEDNLPNEPPLHAPQPISAIKPDSEVSALSTFSATPVPVKEKIDNLSKNPHSSAAAVPAVVCEQPLADKPHIISMIGVGDRRNAEINSATITPLSSLSMSDFERQCHNREGNFSGKDKMIGQGAKLPLQLDRYITEEMLMGMKLVEFPQQLFVGPKSVDDFNKWTNRIYKHVMHRSRRTAPRRAQVGDTIVSQLSIRCFSLEVVGGACKDKTKTVTGLSQLPGGYLINTFQDDSQFNFNMGNAGGEDQELNWHHPALPLISVAGELDDDDDVDFDGGDKKAGGIVNKRMPREHMTVFQGIIIAASSMTEGEYSRFLVQTPSIIIFNDFRVPPDTWLEIELLIKEIKPMGSLQRVLAAPLPESEAGAKSADADRVNAGEQDENRQPLITFKDLQDAVEMGRRECRTLFAAERFKEALFVCWRLRDHVTRFHIVRDTEYAEAAIENPPGETDKKADPPENVAGEQRFEQRRTQKDHLLSDVYVNISRCLSKISDHAAAFEAADIALNYRADNINAMFMAVRTLVRAGDYEKAREKLHACRLQVPALLNDNEEFIRLAGDLDRKLQLSKKTDKDLCRRMLNLQDLEMSGFKLTPADEPPAAEIIKPEEKQDFPLNIVEDHDDDDELTKKIAARVDRKFARHARQILSRFYENVSAVSEPWPSKEQGVVSLDEAQYVKALNMQMQNKNQSKTAATLVEVDMDESSMHVGKFLVMLRKTRVPDR